MSKDRQHFILQLLSSKVTTGVVSVLIILVAFGLYTNYTRQKPVQQEISKLEKEIEELQGKKIELAKLAEVLESANYIEKEARSRLGYKKPGEKVVSIPESARPKPRVLGTSEALETRPTNPIMWFRYFFSKE